MPKAPPSRSPELELAYHTWRKTGRRVGPQKVERIPPSAREEIEKRIQAATKVTRGIQPQNQFDHLVFTSHLVTQLEPVKVRLFRSHNRQVDPEIQLRNASDGLVHTQGEQALWLPEHPGEFAGIVGFELDIAKPGDPVDPLFTWSFTLDPEDPLPWCIKILGFDVDPPDGAARLRVTLDLALGDDPNVVTAFDVTL